MDKDLVIAKLREHRDELVADGVVSLSLFGSVARGEATDASDVDVAVKLDMARMRDGFGFFGDIEDLRKKLEAITGRPVDIVCEPVQKERLARRIERDRQLAF